MNAVSSAENIEYKVYRFKYKKQLNILISLTISVLGFCSFFISVIRDMNWDFLSDFRFMTINGTVFTSIISLITAVISLAEIIKGEDIKLEKFYFLRLTSVVTESIIAIVILMSLFPFIPDKPNILKYDPILTIVSFLIAEPPSEKIKPIMRFNGSALITIYSVIIVSLILWGVIPQSEIPYSFLEVNTRPLWYILLAGVIIYAGAYFLSWGYIELNKKISKSWYD